MADQKISDLTDGGALQATDELVVARGGANVRISGDEVGTGDVTGPGSSTAGNVATFADASGKVLQESGPLATPSLTDVSNTAPTDGQVLKWVTANNQYEPTNESGGSGFELFDAYVGSGETYTTLKAAIDAGHSVIKVTSNTTETASITLTNPTSVWFGNGFFVDMGDNRINVDGNVFDLHSTVYDNSSGITFALTASNPCIYTTGGGEVHTEGVVLQNNSTAADCPVVSGILLTWKDVTVITPDQLTSGVEAAAFSTLESVTIQPAGGTQCSDLVTTANDCRVTNLYIQSSALPSARVLAFGTDTVVDQIVFDTNTSSFEIHTEGNISNVDSSGGQIALYTSASYLSFDNLKLGTATGAVIPNGNSNSILNNVICASFILLNASDTNWKAINCRFEGLVNIQADNTRILHSDCLAAVNITNADNCSVVDCQIDSDAGGGSNLLTISGTSAHCIVTNNKVNQLPSDTSTDPTLNLIDDNTIHGSGPSGGGDVKGPSSSTDNFLVQFDGTTGKLIKQLGLPVTSTLTDISNTAPTNGQILKFNSGSGVYEPSNPSAGSIDPFYDAIVATAGADYTTVSAAVAAGHKYILVEATIVSPVIETANVVLTDDVYVFVKGSWQTDDYQIEFSASDTTLRIEGNNTVDSQITVVLSTAVGLLLNTNPSTVIMRNIAYNNQSSGGEGSGALAPTQGYLLENVYMSCPNDIACGLDARGSSGNEICVMKDCQVNGGGTSCGAMIIPGQNDLIKDVLITGDFFQFPGDTDSVTNKHAVIWTDTASPNSAKLENIVINPTTTAITPSFVVSGTCKNWSTDNDISITIYSVASETLLDGIDFGPAIVGPATGGFLNLWQNSTNVKVVNCKNIGDVTSNTTPNNCTISDTYFSNNMIVDWENLGMSNCYSDSNFTFSGDRLRLSNCRIEGSISVSGTGSILNSNTVGTGSNLSTITLEAGSQSCIATSNVTYSIISDTGTGNTTANNIVP